LCIRKMYIELEACLTVLKLCQDTFKQKTFLDFVLKKYGLKFLFEPVLKK